MKLSKIQRMYILSFLFSLHVAISAYVNSTFLTQFISEKYVGLLYTVASIITLLLLSESSVFLKNFGNRKLSIALLIINMIGLAGLITSHTIGVIAFAFISILTTNTLISLCLDIFIEHFGDPKTIGHTRAFYLMIGNAAWVISPLITSFFITQVGGYTTIYIVSFFTTLAMTLGLFLSVPHFADRTYTRTPFMRSYAYLKENRHMFAITIIDFILQFFYTLMVIYTPIYLVTHLGFSWSDLGVLFTVMLIPFIIFGPLVGVLVDTYNVSKRKILVVGFSIITLATLAIPFTTTHNLTMWALILFLTRTGATLIETTSEIYFFTHVKEEDAFLLGIFRDMTPIGYIVAPLFATVVFTFIPFKYIFVALAVVLLAGFYYIPHLKHHHEPTEPLQEPIIT